MSYNIKIFFYSFKCNSLNISTQEIYDLDHFHNYGHKYLGIIIDKKTQLFGTRKIPTSKNHAARRYDKKNRS